MNDIKIIDAHTHIYPDKIAQKATEAIGDFYGLGMRGIGTAGNLINEMHKAGVSLSLICSCATTPHQVASINDSIHAACALHPEFFGLGTLHQDMKDPYAEIDRIISLGLHGVKLHPDFQKLNIDDPKMMPVYEYLTEKGLPVLFHTGDNRYDYSAPKRLKRVVEAIRGFKCTAAHFGGYQAWAEAAECLTDENIYIDTSSSMAFIDGAYALALIDKFGTDRCMFGSDFPMECAATEIKRITALGLQPNVLEKIMHGNFETYYNLAV